MTIDSKLKAIIDRFDFPGSLVECREIKTGHINRTYRLLSPCSGRGLFTITTAQSYAVVYFFPHPGNSTAMALQCQFTR